MTQRHQVNTVVADELNRTRRWLITRSDASIMDTATSSGADQPSIDLVVNRKCNDFMDWWALEQTMLLCTSKFDSKCIVAWYNNHNFKSKHNKEFFWWFVSRRDGRKDLSSNIYSFSRISQASVSKVRRIQCLRQNMWAERKTGGAG